MCLVTVPFTSLVEQTDSCSTFTRSLGLVCAYRKGHISFYRNFKGVVCSSCKKLWNISYAVHFEFDTLATDIFTTEIVLSPLHELRLAIASSTADDGEINFTPKRVLALSPPNATPSHVTFAFRDERLVVGLTEGPLLVYDTKSLLCQGNDNVQPLETIQPTGPGAVLQVLANPEDIPELVAVRRDVRISIDALAVEILDVNKLEVVGGWRSGETPATTPTASMFR